MLRAAAYCRVSTKEQSDGVSIEAQRAACERYARQRGWKLVGVYQDVETGRNDDRVQFVSLCRQLPDLDVVVSWKVDRVSRRALTCLEFLEECEGLGTHWATVTDGFDVTTAIGRAALGIAASFAQLESEQIGERVSAAIQHSFAAGGWPRKAPYGYERRNGSVEVHEEEAEIVRRIFRERVEGRTQEEIARVLRQQRLRRRGQIWRRHHVGQILENPRYIGEPWIGINERVGRTTKRLPRHKWRRVPGLLPAIVERPVWEVARMRDLRGRRPSKPALFRGVLVCGHCDQRMYVRSFPIMGYQCLKARGGCDASLVREQMVRKLLLQQLNSLSRRNVTAHVEPREHDRDAKVLEEAQEKAQRAWMAFIEKGVGFDVAREAQGEVRMAEAAVKHGVCPPLSGKALKRAITACRQALNLEDIETGNGELRRIVARLVVHQEPTARIEVVLWAGRE